jgi:hypothetical protein
MKLAGPAPFLGAHGQASMMGAHCYGTGWNESYSQVPQSYLRRADFLAVSLMGFGHLAATRCGCRRQERLKNAAPAVALAAIWPGRQNAIEVYRTISPSVVFITSTQV